jgi:hypothetical protein
MIADACDVLLQACWRPCGPGIGSLEGRLGQSANLLRSSLAIGGTVRQ